MLQRRTDLAVEAEALSKPTAAPEGVRVREDGCVRSAGRAAR